VLNTNGCGEPAENRPRRLDISGNSPKSALDRVLSEWISPWA
jgi:hypothetical protein